MRKVLLGMTILASLMATGCSPGLNKTKLDSLEQTLSTVMGRVERLECELDFLSQKLADLGPKTIAKSKEKDISASPTSLSEKDIQAALKKAGFYNGSIDGKIGPVTIKAVKAFQKANGFKPDGIIGTKTKDLLAKYLSEESAIN